MLTETAGIDFELYEEYQIDMRFTDGGGLVDEFKVNVQIVDVNEYPIIPTDQTGTVDENSDPGTSIVEILIDNVDSADDEYSFM